MLRRLRRLLHPDVLDREIDEELVFHLEKTTEENVAAGMSPEEARRAALLALGNPSVTKEDTRTVWTLRAFEGIGQDLRHAARALARSPGFSAVAIAMLAIALGAATAVFSVLDTVMLRPLPVREPRQLVELLHTYPGEPRTNGFSREAYEMFRDQRRVLSGIAGAAPSRFAVRGTRLEEQVVRGRYVVGDYFPVLGIEPLLGRFLGPEDDRIGRPSPAAVVSWSFWKDHLGLDPDVVGRRLRVGGATLTIVGVAPPDFRGLQTGLPADLWVPWAAYPMVEGPDTQAPALNLIGRLRADVPLEKARAELGVLGQRWVARVSADSADPLLRKMRFEITPASTGFSILRDRLAAPIRVLMGLVVLVLLVAWANLAGLLLARGAAREHETAVRVALGAGRLRLLRGMLAESALLSAIGGVLGGLLAFPAAEGLLHLFSSERRMSFEGIALHAQLSGRVMSFMLVAAIATGIVLGLVAGSRAFSAAVAGLRRAGRGIGAAPRRSLAKGLVIAQAATSVVLLTMASLFAGALWRLDRMDLGFRRDRLLVVTLASGRSGGAASGPSIRDGELLSRLEGIPGVRSATLSAVAPLSGAGAGRMIQVEGREADPRERRHVAVNWVAPRYFETYGTPLLEGREFTVRDQDGPHVAVVNRRLAQRYFGQQEPIGRRLKLLGETTSYEVVGVVADARYSEMGDAPATLYLAAFQARGPFDALTLWVDGDPRAVVPAVRRVANETLGDGPIAGIATMSEQVQASIVSERIMGWLSGALGILAGLLAAAGVYAILSYLTTRRTGEIGLRLALGATTGDVGRMVLREAVSMLLISAAMGVPAAFGASRLLKGTVSGVAIPFPLPAAFGVAAMVGLGLVAGSLPARRATRVDPAVALRTD